MPSLTILKIIHSHIPTRPLITIIMTVRVHMVNIGLKNNSKASGQEQTEKTSYEAMVDKDNINEGDETRCRRIVRMPDRLMYQ